MLIVFIERLISRQILEEIFYESQNKIIPTGIQQKL